MRTSNFYSKHDPYLAWEISTLSRRISLAAAGFLFEVLVAIALLILTSSRADSLHKLNYGFNLPLFFISFFIFPVGLVCWFIWYRGAAQLRKLNTELLNKYADAESFKVPYMSPLTTKFAPEAAAILAIQAIVVIYFFALAL